MSREEMARIILEEINEEYTISTYLEDDVLKGIIAGLKRIEKKGAENG